MQVADRSSQTVTAKTGGSQKSLPGVSRFTFSARTRGTAWENHRRCQPERRRWQDNDSHQSGGKPGCQRPADAPRGRRSAANASSGVGIRRGTLRRTLYHALILDEPLHNIIQPTELPALQVAPADRNLAGAEVELVNLEEREFVLRRVLENHRQQYDYIIIDCPPSLGLLTINALSAADSVLVPIQCEYFALEGVSELLDTLARIRRSFNPTLAIEGFLLTMFDERTNLSNQVMADLRDFYGKQVFETVITRNIRLKRQATGSPSFSTTSSRGGQMPTYNSPRRSSRMTTRRALGRGLSALLPERTPPASETLLELDIERILPNLEQPRVTFHEGKLEELAQSIREHGLLQPIVVRPQGENFQIIAGERRGGGPPNGQDCTVFRRGAGSP